jgi:hypothetical protein
MPATKSAQQTVDKWQRRASVAQPEYQAGVQNPRTPWAEAAGRADANYRTAVTQAAAAGKFAQGVSAAGNEKWSMNSLRKGPSRFVEGVQLSGPQFQDRISQVLSTIQSVTLPPRGPKGSPQNYQRTAPIGEALRRSFGKTGTPTTR